MSLPKANSVFQRLIFPALLSIILLLSSCNNDNNEIDSNAEQFNLDLFEQNLIDYVNVGGDSPVGWAYAITQNGERARDSAFGFAINEPDGTQVSMTTSKEIYMASVSKFYTTIGVLQLLDKLNISVNTAISGYLPGSWTQGVNINSISFSHLLRHEAGFDSSGIALEDAVNYNGLKQAIQNGISLPAPTLRDYDNVNFAIFRILIPSLQNQVPNAPFTNIESDLDTQLAYKNYMQTEVFEEIGLSNVDFTVEAINPTKYYNVSDITNMIPGLQYEDRDHISGAGGYFMSVLEMATVNAFFQHSETLLSNDMKDLIRANYFGLDEYFNGDPLELHGKYYGKNGGLSSSSNASINQGVVTQIQMFPSVDVEIAVVVNTREVTYQTGSDDFLRSTIKQAFNDAWQ